MVELVNMIKVVIQEPKLQINIAKTIVMDVDRAECHLVFAALVKYEAIRSFTYSDSTIKANGCSSAEIRLQIALGRAA